MWQLPHCIGGIDRKHLDIQLIPHSGSIFYNYKKSHLIVLMAVMGPYYQCLCADFGTNGRVSDGRVWSKTSLARAIEDRELLLPEPEGLPSGVKKVPYVFVGDGAFPLKTYLMKPYPQSGLSGAQRIFNCRLSRARRISENFFGMLANPWRIVQSAMLLLQRKYRSLPWQQLHYRIILEEAYHGFIYTFGPN